MPLDIIIGTQWGDEGKGRMVDLLSSQADVVARYNGGDNAGHTVTVKDKTFKLHLLPSGLIHPHTKGVLGNGMVINPSAFNQEINLLKSNGIEINPQRLFISHAAHIITPIHLALDGAKEKARANTKLGTTLRGIGPAYTSKAARDGIRMESILDENELKSKLQQQVQETNQILALYSAKPLDEESTINQFLANVKPLKEYVCDTSQLVYESLKQGKTVLAEGAQGVLLDIDHGTYPFVTSSTTTAIGALSGLGVGANWVRRVIGITKVFQTRVGEGPFPTEVFDETATLLRGSGANAWDEYGTTTGRPRRVGWLDIPLLRYACRISGVSEIFLTKLDVLSNLLKINLCNQYSVEGKLFNEMPISTLPYSSKFTPIYTTQEGWLTNIQHIRNWQSLPKHAKDYVNLIQSSIDVPISGISVGAERDQIIRLN